jgi:hypothetical protein
VEGFAEEEQEGMTTATPFPVSRFEASLLRLLRSFLRNGPGETAPPTPAGKVTAPKCLSANCVHLVRDSLSKGCALYLAKAGGWRRERHLRQGQPAVGRLWERTPPEELGLSFSLQSLHFLVWLTAGRPEKHDWQPQAAETTTGDLLLLFLAYAHLREQEAGQALRNRAIILKHGLIALFFPEDFAQIANSPGIDFDIWIKGTGASIVEALQPRLHQRWLTLERGKHEITDWIKMRALGQAQERSLSGFLQAARQANRPDLARFLLKAASELLSPDLTSQFWLTGLKGSGPPKLAERIDVQRGALATVRQFEKLGEWTKWAGSVSFVDDEDLYAAAQLWLSDWEQYRGKELLPIAQQLLRQIEPLQMKAAGSSASTEPAPHPASEGN